jgi:hypothetical protein
LVQSVVGPDLGQKLSVADSLIAGEVEGGVTRGELDQKEHDDHDCQ